MKRLLNRCRNLYSVVSNNPFSYEVDTTTLHGAATHKNQDSYFQIPQHMASTLETKCVLLTFHVFQLSEVQSQGNSSTPVQVISFEQTTDFCCIRIIFFPSSSAKQLHDYSTHYEHFLFGFTEHLPGAYVRHKIGQQVNITCSNSNEYRYSQSP